MAKFIRYDLVSMSFALILMSIATLTILIFVGASLLAPVSVLWSGVADYIGLTRDGSFAELLGYGSALVAAANFLIVYLMHQSRLLLFLGFLMTFIAIDDALQYHENMGKSISEAFAFSGHFGLRAQDFGELAAWAIAGAILAVLFLWSLLRSTAADLGVIALALVPFTALAVCGVVFDALHALGDGNLGRAAALVEDGGELIALVMLASYSVGLVRNADAYYRCDDISAD